MLFSADDGLPHSAKLTARDCEQLVYAVSRPVNGYVSRAIAPTTPIESFNQAELAAGSMLFVHDSSGGADAGFDVVVSDHAGASSGAPRTVTVAVIDPT